MDDALLVRRLERLGDLPRDCERLVDRHRPAPRRSARSSPSTSSIDEKCAVARRDVLEAVDGGDVRVVERGEQLRLALEAGQPLGVAANAVGQHLDGDVATELGVRARGNTSPMPPAPRGDTTR